MADLKSFLCNEHFKALLGTSIGQIFSMFSPAAFKVAKYDLRDSFSSSARHDPVPRPRVATCSVSGLRNQATPAG